MFESKLNKGKFGGYVPLDLNGKIPVQYVDISGITGAQGPDGAQGPEGFQGTEGFQGFQGPDGAQGPEGFQGTEGFQGFQGPDGAQGHEGFQGTEGFQGFQGPQGTYPGIPTLISSGNSAPGSAVVTNPTNVNINFSDGIGTAWSFGATSITFPDDTVQTTAYIPPPYKVYTALLTRTGATAPNATVLENTLGTITYGYNAIGGYTINSSNLFSQNKTVVFTQKQGNGELGNTLGIIILSQSLIILNQTTSSGTNNVDWGFPVSIEIRVYN